MELDATDRKLLNLVQAGLPLVARPFDRLAESLGASADDVLVRVRRLKDAQIIRQVSGIFDTASLGYASSLVAARVAPDRVADAAAIINRHPGVTHNYRRNHDYNLWFTLATPPASTLGLERTADILREQSAAQAVRLLPATRLFKIGVQLDLLGEHHGADETGDSVESYSQADRARAAEFKLSPRDIAIIRVLQDDLPLVRAPFDPWADRAGVGVDELLSAAARLIEHRQMRRFAAVLHHRAAGFHANAMGVWNVPLARIDAVGQQLAAFREVSHCYQRPTYPDWPYNLFTMVHGRSRDDCEAAIAAMRRAAEVDAVAVLYSVEEYKKTRLRYFTGEIQAWEQSLSDSAARNAG